MAAAECFTPKQLLVIRFWIGNDHEITGSELQALAADLETQDPLVVARQIVGQALADMEMNQPAQSSLSGDSQESWNTNIAGLRKRLAKLEAEIDEQSPIEGAPTIVEVGTLERSDRFRLWGNA